MPSTYENFGVSFLYPENWNITDEQAGQSPFEVSLQSPGGGLWMLRVYSTSQPANVLLDEVVHSMQSEYESIESELVHESFEGTEVLGCEMNFYYLDLVVTAKAHCFSDQQRTYVVHAQAESREFDELEPVFRAMMLSLLRSNPAENAQSGY